MRIKSTFRFDVKTAQGGTIEKTALTTTPLVVDGVVSNEPPQEDGVFWLVNAAVFTASSRQDFIMLDQAKTVRDSEGKAVAQGGWIGKNGEKGDF